MSGGVNTAALVFLHTCEVPGLVAGMHGGRLVVHELGPRGPGGRTVLGAVHQVLAALQVCLADMAGVLVTIGPGSFTGVRVGIATAQGLAAARRWRVLACDSLVLDAMASRGDTRPVAVCHDARRGEVYVCLYDVRGTLPVPLLPAFCAAPVAARLRLQAVTSTAGVCIGSGAGLVATVLPSWRELPLPSPEQRAQAALALAGHGACADLDASQLEPFYLRHPDIGNVPRGA